MSDIFSMVIERRFRFEVRVASVVTDDEGGRYVLMEDGRVLVLAKTDREPEVGERLILEIGVIPYTPDAG